MTKHSDHSKKAAQDIKEASQALKIENACSEWVRKKTS